jgi:hypothetical protein
MKLCVGEEIMGRETRVFTRHVIVQEDSLVNCHVP